MSRPLGPRRVHTATRHRHRRLATGLLAVGGLVSTLLTATAATPAHGATAPHGGRPNIVFVLTDDLDTGLVQYMPHVRDLASRGISFSKFVVADSWCCPSRASIFTGEFPHDTGVRNNGQNAEGGFGAFHRNGDEDRTFAVHLQAAGYRTAFLGKYLNGYHPTATVPTENGHRGGALYVPPGWDEWYGLGKAYASYDYVANHDGRAEAHGHAPSDYLNTVLEQQATAFLGAASTRSAPFLLEVSSFTPHAPFAAAPRDTGTFRGTPVDHGPAWDTLPTDPPAWLAGVPPITDREARLLDSIARKRAAAVQSVDRMVAHLQQVLQANGQLANTVFVFSSDNGYHLGEHRLRNGKLTAYDTDIRVPLIAAGPGIPAGATSDLLAQNIDLAPTFEALGGAAVPTTVDGHSLVDVLHGGEPAHWRTGAFVEHQGAPADDDDDPDRQPADSGRPTPYEAVRGPDYAYVQYESGEREYYDLRTDPDELVNLAGRMPATKLSQLSATVAALGTCAGKACWSAAGGG